MGKNNRIRRLQKISRKAKRKKEIEKKKNKLKRNTNSTSPVFYKIPNPFDGISEKDKIEIAKEIAQNSEKKYSESLAVLSHS